MSEQHGDRIRFGSASHIGLEREAQEDALLAEDPLFIVADGMGGHAAGDVAAQTACEVIRSSVGDGEGDLTDAVRLANREILHKASQESALQGMGTTVTAMVAHPQGAEIAHVGDSRAYLLRGGSLKRITQDHTPVDRLVRQGQLTEEEAAHHPARSRLERALGVEEELDVDRAEVSIKPGDRLLLCTDGLTSMVTDEEIREILVAEDDPQRATKRLVDRAVAAGGLDNVTAVVVDYPGVRAAPEGLARAGRRKKAVAAAALLVAVLAVLAGGVTAARNRSYYVGTDQGRVVIFRGFPGTFAGLELNEVEERTDMRADSLPEPFQQRLEEGIRVADLKEAREQVEELRTLPRSEEAP